MPKTEKELKPAIIAFLSFFFLSLLFILETASVFCQPAQKEEPVPEVRLETITFRVREIQSSPAPLILLEVHVSLFNPGQKVTFPPNSIKLMVVPREITFLRGSPKDQPNFQPETTTLSFPLAPRTGRILVTAFSLPAEAVESITFDIQVNPPQGEKKTATWQKQ